MTTNSLVCVDASLIVRAVTPGPDSPATLARLERWQSDQVRLIAPSLLAFEVTSTLRRLVHLSQLRPDLGETAFRAFLALPIDLVHRPAVVRGAWQLARDFNLGRAYDMAYVALAYQSDCEFWTADARLHRTVHGRFAWVHWIGDFAA